MLVSRSGKSDSKRPYGGIIHIYSLFQRTLFKDKYNIKGIGYRHIESVKKCDVYDVVVRKVKQTTLDPIYS